MHRVVIITEWSAKTFVSGLICLLALSVFVACSVVEQEKLGDEGMTLQGKILISFANERLALRYRFVGKPGDGILYVRSVAGVVQNQFRIEKDQLFILDPKSRKLIRYSDRMMKRDFGISLPLEGMTFWVAGQPISNQEYRVVLVGVEGSLVSFEQFGWNISYDGFITRGDEKLPKRIKAFSGDIEVILTIDG